MEVLLMSGGWKSVDKAALAQLQEQELGTWYRHPPPV